MTSFSSLFPATRLLAFIAFCCILCPAAYGQAGLSGLEIHTLGNNDRKTISAEQLSATKLRSQQIRFFHNYAAKEDNFWRLSFGMGNSLQRNLVTREDDGAVLRDQVERKLEFGPGFGYGSIIGGTQRVKLVIFADIGLRYELFSKNFTTIFNPLTQITTESTIRRPSIVRTELNLVPGLQWYLTPKVALGWEVRFGPSISFQSGTQTTTVSASFADETVTHSQTRQFIALFNAPTHMLSLGFNMDALFGKNRKSNTAE